MVEARRSGDFLLKLRNFTRIPLISNDCWCAANSDLLLLLTDVACGTTLELDDVQAHVC